LGEEWGRPESTEEEKEEKKCGEKVGKREIGL